MRRRFAVLLLAVPVLASGTASLASTGVPRTSLGEIVVHATP